MSCQAPLSMEFSRQEYWSGLPFPSPGDLPNPGIEPGSPALQADSLPTESTSGKPRACTCFSLLNGGDPMIRQVTCSRHKRCNTCVCVCVCMCVCVCVCGQCTSMEEGLKHPAQHSRLGGAYDPDARPPVGLQG